MKLLSFGRDGQVRFGALVSGDRVLDLTAPFNSAIRFLEGGEEAQLVAMKRIAAAEQGDAHEGTLLPLSDVHLLPPVPDARKLLALAGNYRAHIREGGRETYPKEETYPYFFMKPPSTGLIGSGEPLGVPAIARKLDYEGELAIVIGSGGRSIAPERVLEHVAGYTIVNDISERGLAAKDPPKAERDWNRFYDWLVGKWFDGGAPCGPWLVTSDEVGNPHELKIQTRVNGEVRQDATTEQMIFSVQEIVAFISRFVTLESGDLIATGTPAGVGNTLGIYLKPGDIVEVEIERIGVLRTPVVASA